MSCRIVRGNLLDDASTVTMTPAADALYPASGLNDGPGGLPVRFSSLAANPEVEIDQSPVPYGDGDGPGAASGLTIATYDPVALALDIPTDWEVEGSNEGNLRIFDDATAGFADHGGNGLAIGMGASTGADYAFLEVTVRAGESLFVHGWVRKVSANVSLRVFLPVTNQWLTVAGAWTSSPTDLAADSVGSAWIGMNGGAGVAFEVPSVEELGAEETVLEIRAVIAAAGIGMFDDLVLTRPADFMMVAGGHNIPEWMAPKCESSDNGSSWTTRATFTVRRRAFWALLTAPVTARFWRLKMTGSPQVDKLWLGELILGLSEALPKTPFRDSLSITYTEQGQARNPTPGGTEWVANRSTAPVRRLAMSFRFATAAETESARALLVDALRGGAVACVFLPTTVDLPDVAVFGRIEGPLTFDILLRTGALPVGDGLEHYSDLPVSFLEGPLSSVVS